MSNVALTPQSPIPSLASQPFAARLQRALHHLRLGRPVILMDDFDRENEADLIRRRGGTVIHILRPNALAVNPHISEAGIAANSADLTLPNYGTVEDFLRSLDEVFLMIRERHQRAEQQSA